MEELDTYDIRESDKKTYYIRKFFKRMENIGCFFPSEKKKIIVNDINSMRKTMKYMFYDEDYEVYGVEIKRDIEKKGYICDKSRNLILENFVIYKFNDENVIERYISTLSEFVNKFPNSIALI